MSNRDELETRVDTLSKLLEEACNELEALQRTEDVWPKAKYVWGLAVSDEVDISHVPGLWAQTPSGMYVSGDDRDVIVGSTYATFSDATPVQLVPLDDYEKLSDACQRYKDSDFTDNFSRGAIVDLAIQLVISVNELGA